MTTVDCSVEAKHDRDGDHAEKAHATVTTRFFADLRDLFGAGREVRLTETRDVAGLLAALCDSPLRRRVLLDDHGECGKRVAILVNGRNIAFLGGESAKLSDSDVIDFFPPVFGG
jgi:MoaD family protein